MLFTCYFIREGPTDLVWPSYRWISSLNWSRRDGLHQFMKEEIDIPDNTTTPSCKADGRFLEPTFPSLSDRRAELCDKYFFASVHFQSDLT